MSNKMKKQHKQILGFIITLVFIFSVNFIGELMLPNIAGFDNDGIDGTTFHLADVPFKDSITVGTDTGPVYLDPLQAWDYGSDDVIRQTVEGLYMLNYSDEDLPRIPILAVDDGSWSDLTTWTVDLRQGVLFHDGTKFNATAVKWNFDRLNWFLNTTGNITNGTIVNAASRFMLNATTPIIKNVTIESEYQVTFYLNAPFSPLLDLLTFIPSYILSPSSTPFYQYINTTTGDIVGTGPFVFDNYTVDTEVRFHGWNQYWRTPAQIENLTILVIQDELLRNNAMLNGTIDILRGEMESLLPLFRADPEITVEENGIGLGYYYLGMNNEQINATMREAISYAINYTHIIEKLMNGMVTRAFSTLGPAFFPGWNQSIELDTPVFNVTHARKVLVDAGLSSLALDDDTGWQAATLATFNYSYNSDNQFRTDLYPMLRDNLDQIGINVTDAPMTWVEYIYTVYGGYGSEGYDRLQLYWASWSIDYLEPWHILDDLYNNASQDNSAQVNDSIVQTMLTNILSELDVAKRTEIYKQIIGNLTGRVYPHAFGYNPYIFDVYSNKMNGFPSNNFDALYIYPCYWDTSNFFMTISRPADLSYIIGSVGNNITWIVTTPNISSPMYYIYKNNILAQFNSWSSGTPIVVNVDGLGTGTYEYRIEVHNGNETIEDIVKLTVNPVPESPIIIIIIIIIVIGSVITISTGSMYVVRENIVSKRHPDKYTKKKKIGAIGKKPHKGLPKGLSDMEPKSMVMETETIVKKKKKLPERELLEGDELSEEEKKELERTESEVDVQKEQFTCIVHRGAIVGTVYICPHCQTIYCQKCAEALKEKGEKCWSCENDIEVGELKTKIKSSPIDNSKLHKLFDGENIIEKISEPRGINVTLLSEDFFNKLEQLDWEDVDKEEFIKEMLTLTPEKRERILDEMIEKSRIDRINE